jgi:hypothetical protein
VMKPTLAGFPLPNGPDTAHGLARFSASYADPSTLDATSIRIDRTFGSALTVFGRYNYAPSDAESRRGSFAIATGRRSRCFESFRKHWGTPRNTRTRSE